MQTPIVLYIATVLGGIALLLLLPKQRGNVPALGTLLGAAVLGGTWLFLNRQIESLGGLSNTAFIYYYVFSAIAIVAAVRVITHTRPVYSALWFVLVVLASSGLLLVLSAEFMAFAMIIIYAGAILVTYMFVIMLASQSQSPDAPADEPETSPVYDRLAREPFSAVLAGFVLLAALLTVAFPPTPMQPNPQASMKAQHTTDQELIAQVLADRAGATVQTRQTDRPVLEGQEQLSSAQGGPAELSNAERIGLDLFRSHPLGLELAGVILLISLIGAVVIAKTRVEEAHQPAQSQV